MAVIVDSYSENNVSYYSGIYEDHDGSSRAKGQSFASNGGVLNSCSFLLKKINSPTGNCYAKIFAHTGTYGTSSKPTGSALATSDAFDTSILTGDGQLISFNFSGANKITLENGTYYVVVIEYDGGSETNQVGVGQDETSPAHSGNSSIFINPDWYEGGYDLCFYVYGDIVSPFPTFFRL